MQLVFIFSKSLIYNDYSQSHLSEKCRGDVQALSGVKQV